tara:strand:+ start:623 stop:988 length:366 start_codon:yes stop_codon:yes gene_type:complete
MKKKFNTKSITITVNAVQSFDKLDRGTDRRDTELKHDALQLLLNSPNPLRCDYNFEGDNGAIEEDIYSKISILKEKMKDLIFDTECLLICTKKNDLKLESLENGCKVTYGQYSYKGHTEEK